MASEAWKPGSFTKNFSWGEETKGLSQLYENIRLGFADRLEDVPRETYRKRVRKAGRPDYIPINFFLFNRPGRKTDYLVVDELVFQALTSEHSPRFDMLALFAFNFSYVGKWAGQRGGQRRPALWALHYVKERVAGTFDWDAEQVSADDIEDFVLSDERYEAKGARKLSTNLNYLYRKGRLSGIAEERVARWWVDAVFLALDRLIEDRSLDGYDTRESQFSSLLASSDFPDISGPRSAEKDLAARHLCRLYAACGGRDRFFEDEVRKLIAALRRNSETQVPNDARPRGAVHPTNPRILKSIPWICAPLAMAAGYQVLDPEQLADFDPKAFIRDHTRAALAALREEGVTPDIRAFSV